MYRSYLGNCYVSEAVHAGLAIRGEIETSFKGSGISFRVLRRKP